MEVIERVATVLVIACPHALGLAIPLVVAITTSIGASNGILIRDRLALEKIREVNMVLFDKTGTLTEGRFGVTAIAVAENIDENEALALAAAVERILSIPWLVLSVLLLKKNNSKCQMFKDLRQLKAKVWLRRLKEISIMWRAAVIGKS